MITQKKQTYLIFAEFDENWQIHDEKTAWWDDFIPSQSQKGSFEFFPFVPF